MTVMKERIPVVPSLVVRKIRSQRATYEKLPGFDEVSQIIAMAQASPEGVDAARRILTQLAHKALKEPTAGMHYRLYQVALEDIGEKFDHPHQSKSFRERVQEMI